MACWAAATAAPPSPPRSRRTRWRRWWPCRSFPDKLAAGRIHFDKLNAGLGRAPIDSKLLFHGPHAFEQLAASPDVDLIQISTPPFFHVQHLEAAVAAGKHVYCEKPVGIDVVQAKHALEIAKRVKPTQSVDVGFQCRNAPPIAAIAEHIKAGRSGQDCRCLRQLLRAGIDREEAAGASPDEYRLRNWLWDRALSGDILVEQNIHIIDLCNWMLGARPLKATATGGTQYSDPLRRLLGQLPGRLHLSGQRAPVVLVHAVWERWSIRRGVEVVRQVKARRPFLTPARWRLPARMHGHGRTRRRQRPAPASLPPTAPSATICSLPIATRSGPLLTASPPAPATTRLPAGVETALSCMLGRMAGLTGREVTWDELLAHGETYQLGFSLDQFA